MRTGPQRRRWGTRGDGVQGERKAGGLGPGCFWAGGSLQEGGWPLPPAAFLRAYSDSPGSSRVLSPGVTSLLLMAQAEGRGVDMEMGFSLGCILAELRAE